MCVFFKVLFADETSRHDRRRPAPALWRHGQEVNNQNMAMLPIFQGQLAMFTEEI